MTTVTVPSQKTFPTSADLDLRAGFLDDIGETLDLEPNAQNLRKRGGYGVSATLESHATDAYLRLLDAVKATLDRGSRYAGRTRAEAATIDRVTAESGDEACREADVVFVAEKYGVPALILAEQWRRMPEYGPGEYRVQKLFRGRPVNSSITRRALLETSAEIILCGLEGRRRFNDTGKLYERALWYRDIPSKTCRTADKRKRDRRAATAGRLMTTLLAHAEARKAPWTLVCEIGLARTYLDQVITPGRVPDAEIEPLVAEILTRSKRALDDACRPELPAAAPEHRPSPAPNGAIASAVITEAEAEADDLARARESIVSSMRRKLDASPDATDTDLRRCGQSKFRPLLVKAGVLDDVIAEARNG